MADLKEKVEILRMKNPVVHHITNLVTINDCANVTLAIGGSPIMALDKNEVEDITRISNSLVLNLGTPSQDRIEAMIRSGKIANEFGIPIILDPVGVGASRFRQEALKKILKELRISIIKGNYGEIMSIYGCKNYLNGVDSQDVEDFDSFIEICEDLALKEDLVVAATGAVDIVTDGRETLKNFRGNTCLRQVSGTGCMTSSLIASFMAQESLLDAAFLGIEAMTRAGDKSLQYIEEEGLGLASFRIRLIDEISRL